MTANPDRHQFPAMVTRPDPELRQRASDLLKANGWTMNEFVEACLDLLAKNPDPMLKRLGTLRREPRKGRPPKTRN